jgi:hypothetical protein
MESQDHHSQLEAGGNVLDIERESDYADHVQTIE